MLSMGANTKHGPIAIIGINDHNLQRMQAGMPLRIDLKSLVPPGKRITEVFVHHAHTYEQVMDDIANGGLPVPQEMRDAAKALDEKAERGAQGDDAGTD